MIVKSLKCVNENVNLLEYLNFYNDIKQKMKHPNWLGNFDLETLQEIMGRGGKIWMYYDKNEIVCSIMLIPADQINLNIMKINCEIIEIGECGPIIVAPKHRGKGLQREMLQVVQNYYLNSNIKYIITTIHPNNNYSINNFVVSGYKFMKTIKLDRGERSIYIKNL